MPANASPAPPWVRGQRSCWLGFRLSNYNSIHDVFYIKHNKGWRMKQHRCVFDCSWAGWRCDGAPPGQQTNWVISLCFFFFKTLHVPGHYFCLVDFFPVPIKNGNDLKRIRKTTRFESGGFHFSLTTLKQEQQKNTSFFHFSYPKQKARHQK